MEPESSITPVPSLAGLHANWSFVSSRPSLATQASRIKSFLTGMRSAPASDAIIAVTPRPRWNGYFIFAPRGGLAPYHRYTLSKLRQLSGGLLVIYACPNASDIPFELRDTCDALYWKALGGFDFSAYALSLRMVAELSPGADLFLMNDSVLGPLCNIEPILSEARWDLTGFTGGHQKENHLQSYAFLTKNVTPQRLKAFGSAVPQRVAYDRYHDVVNLQETRFARLAARQLSVGALWYAKPSEVPNATLFAAVELLEAGFPFVKRSLFGKYDVLQDRRRLAAILSAAGHPLEPSE